MQPTNYPIGSSTLTSLQTTRAGMTIPAKPAPTPLEMSEARAAFKAQRHVAGEVICRSGSGNDRIYLLKSGRVRLMREGRRGVRSVTAILKAGELFGDNTRGESLEGEELAVAAGEVEVWAVEGHDYRTQLEAHPELATELVRAYSERVHSLTHRVRALTLKEVPARLADTILFLADGHGERCPHGGEMDLRGVTQQDLADLVGASRSFVSTLVNEMKRDGMLANVGRTLCLLDLRALRKAASKEK